MPKTVYCFNTSEWVLKWCFCCDSIQSEKALINCAFFRCEMLENKLVAFSARSLEAEHIYSAFLHYFFSLGVSGFRCSLSLARSIQLHVFILVGSSSYFKMLFKFQFSFSLVWWVFYQFYVGLGNNLFNFVIDLAVICTLIPLWFYLKQMDVQTCFAPNYMQMGHHSVVVIFNVRHHQCLSDSILNIL